MTKPRQTVVEDTGLQQNRRLLPGRDNCRDTAKRKSQCEIYKTHVGHQNEIGHLFLTFSERDNIAEKNCIKIPFTSILDEVRDSVADSELKRFHLLTEK